MIPFFTYQHAKQLLLPYLFVLAIFFPVTVSAQFTGSVNVGSLETYTNLTGPSGLFKALNLGTIEGNLQVNITSDLIEDGTNQLNQLVETGAGNYTIHIQSSGPRRLILQNPASASTLMIGLNGADRVTFDGGNDTLLIFRNEGNVIPGIVFQFNNGSMADTIKGCIIESQLISTSNGSITLKTSGTNKVVILDNIIRNYGIRAVDIGIYSGSDLNHVVIKGNKISNCKSYGIYLPYIKDSCIISNNSVYYNFPTPSVLAQRGIAVSSGGGHRISGNYIGGSMPNAMGSPWVNATTNAAFYGIYLIASTNSLTSSVQGNTVSNISMTGSAAFYGIDISANANVGSDSGNVVGSPTITNSITLKSSSGGGTVFGIYSWLLNTNIKNNIIANIADTSTVPNEFNGIYIGGAATINVSKNQVYNIGPTSKSTNSNKVVGIYMFGGNGNTLPYTISNNMISLGNNIVNHNVYIGIQDNGFAGNNMYLYYNSVRIAGTANGSTDSYAFSKTSNTNETHLDNIYYNVRSGGTGKNFAFSKTASSGAFSSNYNLVYATDSIRTCQWGAGNAISFFQWKLSSGGDLNSVNDLVDFISPINLHIDTSSQALWTVNGRGIAISSIPDDIDNDARNTVMGLPTDIGADEFSDGIIEPPLANVSGLPVAGSTTYFFSGGRKVSEIIWDNAGTVPGNILLQYFAGKVPPGYTAHPTIYAYYNVAVTGGSGYTYTIRYYYTDAEKNNIPDANLRIIKQDGTGPWTIIGGIAGINAEGKYIEVSGLSSFSKFSLIDLNAVLPVKLGQLVASRVNKSNILRWQTFTENNNRGFEIQRATDGQFFQVIYFMPSLSANGNSSSDLFYEYIDQNLMGDRQFYRLKQVDKDGNYLYSNVALVSADLALEVVMNIWPNPASEIVNVNVASPSNTLVNFVVTDVMGQVIFKFPRQLVTGDNLVKFAVRVLQPGNYFIKMIFNNGCENQVGRFIKQ